MVLYSKETFLDGTHTVRTESIVELSATLDIAALFTLHPRILQWASVFSPKYVPKKQCGTSSSLPYPSCDINSEPLLDELFLSNNWLKSSCTVC